MMICHISNCKCLGYFGISGCKGLGMHTLNNEEERNFFLALEDGSMLLRFLFLRLYLTQLVKLHMLKSALF